MRSAFKGMIGSYLVLDVPLSSTELRECCKAFDRPDKEIELNFGLVAWICKRNILKLDNKMVGNKQKCFGNEKSITIEIAVEVM